MICQTGSCSISFEKKMKERGMRITPQKRAIYETLCESKMHPTAEELYDTVHKIFPNMSFATVYDNLRKFVATGVCREVYFQDGTARFDANAEEHHHILDKDGRIYDVCLPENTDIPLPSGMDRNDIKEIRITYVTK
ncbi:MAG: Fur family transcriptional regulator [Candidatus Gracilibacteria bacterium]